MAARQRPSLCWPPEGSASLQGFPSRTLERGSALFRIARRKLRSSWWFNSSLEGRFDLPTPEGTCYWAADALGALLEVVGFDRETGVVSREFLAGRDLWEALVPEDLALSDLTSRGARGFGVTAEIGTIVPYECPQAWALRLREAGSPGVTYWLRHDPSRTEGYAFFGPQGDTRLWKESPARQAISGELLRKLGDECGIEVHSTPRLKQLRILGTTEDP